MTSDSPPSLVFVPMVAARVPPLFGYTGRLAAELAAAKNFDVVLSGRSKDALAGLGDRRPNVAAVKEGEEIKDERAANHEQWIVKVRMRDDGRRIEVRADRAQWEKLRESDRVKVTYRVGKYTGTVWDAEID